METDREAPHAPSQALERRDAGVGRVQQRSGVLGVRQRGLPRVRRRVREDEEQALRDDPLEPLPRLGLECRKHLVRCDDEERHALVRIARPAHDPWTRPERLQLALDRVGKLCGRRRRPRPDENVNLPGHAHPL